MIVERGRELRIVNRGLARVSVSKTSLTRNLISNSKYLTRILQKKLKTTSISPANSTSNP